MLIRSKAARRTQAGQTLAIALIVLGVLLVIGFVFLGIISRNVAATGLSQRRTLAREIAEAGIRFVHGQLLTTSDGADWRPSPTLPAQVAGDPDRTLDPDMLYLRPPAKDTGGLPLPIGGPTGPVDLGGPDGLGPYTRIDFPDGRALVRVRWAPSDANVFSVSAAGPLRSPGRARNYTIIESIGRPGRVLFNDPTRLLTGRSFKFKNYADEAEFTTELGAMRGADFQLSSNTNKSIAFVSIGIIESARFITDKDRTNRQADIGYDRELNALLGVPRVPQTPGTLPRAVAVATGLTVSQDGAQNGQALTAPLAYTLGTSLANLGSPIAASLAVDFGGSLFANTDIRVHGDVVARLNTSLGDGWNINGLYLGATDEASLTIDYSYFEDPGSGLAWVTPVALALRNTTNPSLDSRNEDFTTNNGTIRDSVPETDPQGFSRSVGRKEPPSILAVDPETGLSRFLTLTRESGILLGNGNSGRFGHGRNVYVNNGADRQIRIDEQGRERVGTSESLVYDWLNPNNGQAGSGWQGPFYVPRGAWVLLHTDGFTIVRDARAPDGQRFWRWPDGSEPLDASGNPTQSTTIRYRIRRIAIDHDADPATPDVLQSFIVNTFTPDLASGTPPTQSIDINDTIDDSVFVEAGQPFGGVLYFEGNVRIRGVIPTHEQLTVVSNATIYVEGSITKGVIGEDGPITVPSRSMLALLARDYVALNTTQFFGSAPETVLEEADDRQSALAYNPVRVRTNGSLTFITEFLLDPTDDPFDPSTWPLYAATYREFNTPSTNDGEQMEALMLLSHAGDDGPAPATFVGMTVNFGLDTTGAPTPPTAEDWVYHFAMTGVPRRYVDLAWANGATQPYLDAGAAPGSYISDYGLGVEPWQRYPRFETVGFPLIDATSTYDNIRNLWNRPNADETIGSYGIFDQSSNYLSVFPTALGSLPTNDYLVARATMAPHDVRVEATMYAEQGSFFVIPGPPFNPNPNDRWEVFEESVIAFGGFGDATAIQQAQQERLENFGTFPETPFYGEPLDVRIMIVGAIAENMPPPMSQQAAWLRRWGWIPARIGALYDLSANPPRPVLIPKAHVPEGYDINPSAANHDWYVPNLILTYDPHLATGQTHGFDAAGLAIRRDVHGRMLPPLPKLPVSPSLAYFGEVSG